MMKKAIFLLSGTPSGKSRFDEIAKQKAWCWNINFNNFLGALSKNFYWQGERDEHYYQFIAHLRDLVNREWGAEEKYLREKIQKFNADDSEQKVMGDAQFDTFILIVHGVSKNLVSCLEEDYGVFKVHISQRKLNSNIEKHDYILYEDDPDFEEQVQRLVRVLTN